MLFRLPLLTTLRHPSTVSTKQFYTTKPFRKHSHPSPMAAIVDTVKKTIAENFGGPTHQLVPEDQQFNVPDDVPDQTGKVAVITGGARGIGEATVQTLLQKNISKVFILSQTQEGIDNAKEDIKNNVSPSAMDRVRWIPLDLANWDGVAEAAKQIQDETDRVDILVNDAGRGVMTYQVTEYGVDRHFAVNHVGHVILTSSLLPVLKKTAEKATGSDKVRIVGTASNLHQATPGDTKFASLDELNQDLGPNALYGRSKLAVMLYCKYLCRHLTTAHPNILVNSIHPGFVDTKMSTVDAHEPYPIGGYANSVLAKPIKKDQWQGSVSTLFAATKTDQSGRYICPPAVVEEGSKQYQDPDRELEENLMRLTRSLIVERMKKTGPGEGTLGFY